jgi:hypothetical protein
LLLGDIVQLSFNEFQGVDQLGGNSGGARVHWRATFVTFSRRASPRGPAVGFFV